MMGLELGGNDFQLVPRAFWFLLVGAALGALIGWRPRSGSLWRGAGYGAVAGLAANFFGLPTPPHDPLLHRLLFEYAIAGAAFGMVGALVWSVVRVGPKPFCLWATALVLLLVWQILGPTVRLALASMVLFFGGRDAVPINMYREYLSEWAHPFDLGLRFLLMGPVVWAMKSNLNASALPQRPLPLKTADLGAPLSNRSQSSFVHKESLGKVSLWASIIGAILPCFAMLAACIAHYISTVDDWKLIASVADWSSIPLACR
jgi:hypothetical protein